MLTQLLLILFSTSTSDIGVYIIRSQIWALSSRKMDINVHDMTTLPKDLSNGLETNIAVVNRQAGWTTLLLLLEWRPLQQLTSFCDLLQAAAQLRDSRLRSGLGRAGWAGLRTPLLGFVPSKKDKPSPAPPISFISLSTYTLFPGKPALSSHRNVTACRELRD